jgi:hypothetical protein
VSKFDHDEKRAHNRNQVKTSFCLLSQPLSVFGWSCEYAALPSLVRSRSTEYTYFVVVDPRPVGTPLGIYDGAPIFPQVFDCFGRCYSFAGIATRQTSRFVDPSLLGRGEWLVEPGMIYKLEIDGVDKGPDLPAAHLRPHALKYVLKFLHFIR